MKLTLQNFEHVRRSELVDEKTYPSGQLYHTCRQEHTIPIGQPRRKGSKEACGPPTTAHGIQDFPPSVPKMERKKKSRDRISREKVDCPLIGDRMDPDWLCGEVPCVRRIQEGPKAWAATYWSSAESSCSADMHVLKYFTHQMSW